MNKNDFITIQASFVTELGLSGNHLIIYSLIHGFSKDGVHEFNGSISYICEWTNLSRPTVINILKELVERNLVEKRTCVEKGVTFCYYKVGGSKEILPVVKKFNEGGSKKTLPNIDNTKEPNTLVTKEKEKDRKELKEKFAIFVSMYKKMGGKVRGVDTEFDDFTKRHKDWEQVIPYLSLAVQRECKEREKAHFEHRFFPEPKMLQTYLGKQRAWELYVTIGEDLTNSTYNPTCTHELNWNDHYNCYIYMGQTWLSMPENIFDGYSDDDRPNGAKIMLNSGRGTIVWDSATKKWNKQ